MDLAIYQLFKNIITKSNVMRRLVTAPHYGVELNKNNAGEILTDFVGGITDGLKYPLAILFPPTEIVETHFSTYKFKMFFLTTQYNDINGLQDININNNLSTHTIEKTWQDMRSEASSFLEALNYICSTLDIECLDNAVIIERYSDVANDRLAGVGFNFDIMIKKDCEIKGYTLTDLDDVATNFKQIHLSHDH